MYKCHKPRDREIGQQILKNGNKLPLPSLNFFLGVFRDCSSVVFVLYLDIAVFSSFSREMYALTVFLASRNRYERCSVSFLHAVH